MNPVLCDIVPAAVRRVHRTTIAAPGPRSRSRCAASAATVLLVCNGRCIDEWLVLNATCPNCRDPVVRRGVVSAAAPGVPEAPAGVAVAPGLV
jgi:hypothetical protein